MHGGYSMRHEKEEPVVLSGLDIGTRKVSIVVAEKDPVSSDFQILAMESTRSRGISRGEIVDKDLAVESIRKVIEIAESSSDFHVADTILSIGPSTVDTFTMEHNFSYRDEGSLERPVTTADMREVTRQAIGKAKESNDDFLLHAFPLAYSVDEGSEIRDPRGLKGSELSIRLLLVTIPSKTAQDIIDCAEKAGLNVVGIVHKSLASAMGSLTDDEMKHGAVAVDIGAGTTSMAFIRDRAVQDIAIFPAGGDQVTRDIAELLEIPCSKAEYLKREVSLNEDSCDLCDELEFEMDGEPFLTTVKDVLDIVSPRIEEIILRFVKPAIEGALSRNYNRAVVFSGGVSRTPGFEDFLNEYFDGPVRVADPVKAQSLPHHARGNEFASTAGIVQYMIESEKYPDFYIQPSLGSNSGLPGYDEGQKIPIIELGKRSGSRRKRHKDGMISRFLNALKNAFKELF